MVLPSEQKYLNKLIGIIEENLSDSSFGVSELAKEMGISHSTLHRRLKAIAQQTISQFIRETRLKRAMNLLQLQAGSVAEIAYGVGFGSTTYFTKCFRDFYGYPPGEVKKRFDSELNEKKISQQSGDTQQAVRSIAVLPFDNCTGDDSQDYLVFGIHDALIGELGELTGLRVVSKTSVLSYLETDRTIRQIAAELDVEAIVEGTAFVLDEKIQLQLKLIKVYPEERQLLSQTFDMDMSNILTLYSEVIHKIALEIQVKLSKDQENRITNRREVNPESYRSFLRGKHHLYLLTEDGIKRGLEYLHEAVRIDPGEPFAYAGLALGYMEIAHGPLNPGDACIKAQWAAREALNLDPDLAETQLALAELCIYYTWKFEEGEEYFKRALEINPNLSLAHYHYSWLLYLLGRNEEAIFEHEVAQRCDPFNPMITAFTGALYGYLERYEDALREANKSFDIQKDCPDGYYVLGETYLAMGRIDDAIAAHKKLAQVDPVWKWWYGYILAITNHPKKAGQVLDELLAEQMTSWKAMGIAVIYGALGNLDKAWEWIAYQPAHAWIPWVAVMPMWKPLHHDPRFTRFVHDLNLPCKKI
jgi:TolB-like protein